MGRRSKAFCSLAAEAFTRHFPSGIDGDVLESQFGPGFLVHENRDARAQNCSVDGFCASPTSGSDSLAFIVGGPRCPLSAAVAGAEFIEIVATLLTVKLLM